MWLPTSLGLGLIHPILGLIVFAVGALVIFDAIRDWQKRDREKRKKRERARKNAETREELSYEREVRREVAAKDNRSKNDAEATPPKQLGWWGTEK